MNTGLLAMLVLSSCTQVRDERRAADPPRVQTVRIRMGDPEVITLEMPALPAPADEEDEVPPARPVMGFNINAAVVGRENFDRWLFGELSEEERERHLDEILLTRVRTATREHKLTEPQRKKLHLAGKGDIKRFFDQAQTKREEFEKDRKEFNTGLAALRGLNSLSQIYRKGPFGDGSLFDKTLRKIMDDKQASL